MQKKNQVDLSKVKKIFFVGIGGIGISAGAQLALSRGMKVLGLNDEESPKTIEPLRAAGAIIFYMNEMKKLPLADLYVYSDAWLHRGPEVIEEARERGKPVLSYFEFLGVVAKEYKVIAIAGTHGKTTTTAMVAGILIDAGLDPTVVVGSFVKKFGSNFRKGSGKYLVLEADEYNRHFLNFNPFITVVTNIEADHLDYYKDLADVQNAFGQLIAQTENTVIYNSKDTSTHVLVHDNKIKVVDYIKYLDRVPKLSVPGEHNRKNAAAALAVADFLSINQKIAQKSLAEFAGTWRRLEKRGQTESGTIVYDDYAHHPTEIRASIEALRELYPERGERQKNITILFQPHLYSRTKMLFDDFAKSFKGADRVLLLPIYFAREEKDENVSSEKLAKAITKEGQKAEAYPTFPAAEEAILALNLGPKDVLVTMGAGEAYKVADKVLQF
ncbi:hypothetical protein A3C67_03185 [Candidatus Nomurabacteria bacterium RIFCSPHIGHO2_02_FULL_42_19]|uniref:UDP-N-acetylmuramate--L-alanine ligase n=1 Tax=Candidatus Nomurabacteria bacterium RIFCSPHIGHO2_02_FULL_42_19 TaxID=1801756 RepID=A0A1F6W2P0_9BACT|nr:MAG: hypothetical protein A3C67_03185 [Candidatus Nomurabacteria bacterium RIFCSPHIGHO2_02_FULL_42_19]